MVTIIIHGTMICRKAHHYSWWWNGFHPGGFCQAIADGMQAAGHGSDAWMVGGVLVSQIPELARNPRGANLDYPRGSLRVDRGGHRFRPGGGGFLAYYLNTIVRLAPGEPIDVVAHSHGGNVVKIATTTPHLDPEIRLRSVVFLACPHWMSAMPHGEPYPYRLNPARIDRRLTSTPKKMLSSATAP